MAPRVSCMLQTYTKFNSSDAKVKINTLLSRNTHRFNYSNNYLFDASYAIYENCGGILSNQFAANLLENLPVKKIENRLRFDKNMTMSLVCSFWPS